MSSNITYHQQVSYCGKSHCRKCREGIGHGPYWYAYQTVNGRTSRTYVGKQLPADLQVSVEGLSTPPSQHAMSFGQASVRVYTLGQFRLERRNGQEWETVTDSVWQHQRVRALLICLISSPARKLGREQLMDAVWPDLDSANAASRIDRAVYSLRQLFEPERTRPATSSLLLTDREGLALASQQQVWIDANAFEQLNEQAHATLDPGEAERLLEEAMALYGGDFLPEEQNITWTLARREFLQRNWVGLLLELVDLRIAREALASTIEPLDRLLSFDATNEAAVQRLISILAQLGRRGEALRTYKRLASMLQQEYHIAPLPETRAIYDAVRLGSSVAPKRRSSEGDSLEQAQGQSRTLSRQDTVPALQLGRSHQRPLVGREQEFDTLRSLLVATGHSARFTFPGQKKSSFLPLDTQRRPQAVLLMGEVGIGKTRLAEEIGREAKKRGWAVAWSRVYPQESHIPYRLWAEVMHKAMNQGVWKRQEVSNRPLIYQPLTALLPEFDSLLPRIAVPTPQLPEQEQLRLWEAALELLKTISEGTPLLIVLDDMQWADGSSCELFAYLARRLYGHSILIIGTCRENELEAGHPLRSLLTDLRREYVVEALSLQPLSDEQIGTLVSHVHLPEQIVQHIQVRAAGNPFFAEELARTVEASVAVPTTPAAPLLPETIAAVLDLRLARLSSACQRLLGKAAVLGSSFEFHVISAMEATTPGFHEDTVLDLLEEAMRSGMLTEEGVGTRITYQFWHPLLASHLYEKLSVARRTSFHRRAAEVLQQVYRGREEEGAATIAYHLSQVGTDSQQIAHYAELAGDRAYALSAYPEAERHYRLALKYRRPATDTVNADAQLHLAYLLEHLGECTRVQGNDEEARRFYKEALEVRRRHSSPPQLHHARLQHESADDLSQEAQIQALLMCEIGWTWYNMGNNAQARQSYQASEDMLREAEIVAGPAWAKVRFQQSYLDWCEGNYEEAHLKALEALQLLEEVLEKRKDQGQHASRSTLIRRTLQGDPVDLGRIYVLLGLIANSIGQARETITHWNMALALFEQYDRQREIANVSCNLGDVYLKKADHTAAQSSLRRALSLAEQVGDTPLVSVVVSNLGILAARSGTLLEAEAHFKRSFALAEQINEPVYMSLWSTGIAAVMQDQGKLPEATSWLCRALGLARKTHITPCLGSALVAVGNLRIAQARFEGELLLDADQGETPSLPEKTARMLLRARATLQHALALEGQEAETRTEGMLALAHISLLLGDLDRAHQETMQTMELAHQYELTWLLTRCRSLLGRVLARQGKQKRADEQFEQVLRTLHKSHMQLEYARTLHYFGQVLLQRRRVEGEQEREYQRGLGYLHEARRIFVACRAGLDEQLVAPLLARYEKGAEKA